MLLLHRVKKQFSSRLSLAIARLATRLLEDPVSLDAEDH
jgi:hypothetical protein